MRRQRRAIHTAKGHVLYLLLYGIRQELTACKNMP